MCLFDKLPYLADIFPSTCFCGWHPFIDHPSRRVSSSPPATPHHPRRPIPSSRCSCKPQTTVAQLGSTKPQDKRSFLREKSGATTRAARWPHLGKLFETCLSSLIFRLTHDSKLRAMLGAGLHELQSRRGVLCRCAKPANRICWFRYPPVCADGHQTRN